MLYETSFLGDFNYSFIAKLDLRWLGDLFGLSLCLSRSFFCKLATRCPCLSSFASSLKTGNWSLVYYIFPPYMPLSFARFIVSRSGCSYGRYSRICRAFTVTFGRLLYSLLTSFISFSTFLTDSSSESFKRPGARSESATSLSVSPRSNLFRLAALSLPSKDSVWVSSSSTFVA